jgi:hypothetical protein
MWWLHATDPGRMPSVTHALTTKVPDLGRDAHEVTSTQVSQAPGVARVDPQRVRVREFVEPFRVAAARVDLRRQTERGDQRHLPGLEMLRGARGS